MAKQTKLITVKCPCCEAELFIDPDTSAVIRHVEHVKPPSIADMEAAVQRFKVGRVSQEASICLEQ